MDIFSPATFNIRGSKKRIILNQDGCDLIFEDTPFYKTEYEYVLETNDYYIYNPPIHKNKFLCCVYAYTIIPQTIKLYKDGKRMEYVLSGCDTKCYELINSS
jgi:hypothetical protein